MKIAFYTLGCKVNFYETKKMAELFIKNGFEVVEEQEKADIFVINTCTVTNMADRKSRQAIHRSRRKNPDCLVVAIGCYADSDAKKLEEDPSVDIVLGNKEKENIVLTVTNYLKETGAITSLGSSQLGLAEYAKERTRAFIKVQDGCNQFCSYCIIPYVRGKLKSRMIEEITEELIQLAAKGYKEVVITGIHLSSYGVDRQTQKDFTALEGRPLLELLEAASQVKGLERIRLGSLEPRIITEAFLKRLAANEKVCPHFHLSLQSGCDATLARMNRRYTTSEYKEKCRLIRKFYDKPAITTDVIVGFPGETAAEFESTLAFLDEIRLADIHVFKYSPRTGTKAEEMENQVSDIVKAERSNRLISLAGKWHNEYTDMFIDGTERVLFEETVFSEGERYLVGHTERYVKVMVPEAVAERENYKENKIYSVLVKEVL